MPNKTIIITTINAAWTENNSIVDLFLESFRYGIELQVLLKHLIMVAFDQTAYDRCLSIHPHCFQLRTNGVDFSGPQAYNSADYLKMMWRRIEFLLTVLENGYSFIFTDADILWFRNPFPHFLPNEDFQMSADKFNGNSSDINNAPNCGFLYVRASKPTINFYKFWYDSRETHPNKNEQVVFYAIKSDKRLNDMGLKVRFLDTKFFVSFCSFRTFTLDKAATIHGNCCNGLKNKDRNLRAVLDIWKGYRVNSTQKLTWKGPSFCPLYPV